MVHVDCMKDEQMAVVNVILTKIEVFLTIIIVALIALDQLRFLGNDHLHCTPPLSQH